MKFPNDEDSTIVSVSNNKNTNSTSNSPLNDNKSDIWSLGCIVFELFTGRKAFLNDYQVFDYANMRKNQKEFMKQLGTDAKFYIHLLLEKDPRYRPSSKLLMRRKFRAAAFGSNSESLIRKRKHSMSGQSDSEQVTIPRFLNQTVGWAVLNGNIKAVESILFAMGPVTLSEPPCAHAMIQAVFEACINGGVFLNLTIQGAKEELLALWTALACSSPKMICCNSSFIFFIKTRYSKIAFFRILYHNVSSPKTH